jgi:hypothetical protein
MSSHRKYSWHQLVGSLEFATEQERNSLTYHAQSVFKCVRHRLKKVNTASCILPRNCSNLGTKMRPGRRPLETFVDSPCHSESEICLRAVTVSFSKYLPSQAVHFLQRSTHFSKTCCRPLITSKFLVSELPFHGWKSPEIGWGEIWTVWRMF